MITRPRISCRRHPFAPSKLRWISLGCPRLIEIVRNLRSQLAVSQTKSGWRLSPSHGNTGTHRYIPSDDTHRSELVREQTRTAVLGCLLHPPPLAKCWCSHLDELSYLQMRKSHPCRLQPSGRVLHAAPKSVLCFLAARRQIVNNSRSTPFWTRKPYTRLISTFHGSG